MNLKETLANHEKWLQNPTTGAKANLSETDLSGANLSGADLHEADLSGADLSGADLDFSCLPLWCGGLKFKLDEQLAKQIMYHALSLCHEHVTPDAALRRWVNTFHRVGEVPKL